MSETHGSHWLEREDIGNVTVVRLKTPKILDEDTIRAVFDPVSALIGLGRSQIVLNLTAADYLPSLGPGKLVMLNRKAQASYGRLALCHIAPTLDEILVSTHLNDLFNIYATERDALESFS